MTVASGILQSDGKLEQITVRQGREHQQLAEPLIEALQHWLFEPGRINGKPVALKILLGIRLREKDEAFAWLQKTYQGHSSLMVSLKVDPVFDPVRGDSRFQQLLRTSVSPSRTNSRIVASLDLEFHAKIAK